MTELAKEVRLAASYGELSETLQQRIEVVMRFFLALGEGVDTPAEEEPRMKVPPAVPEAPESRVNDDVSIFGMGRGRGYDQTVRALSASHSARSSMSSSPQDSFSRTPSMVARPAAQSARPSLYPFPCFLTTHSASRMEALSE